MLGGWSQRTVFYENIARKNKNIPRTRTLSVVFDVKDGSLVPSAGSLDQFRTFLSKADDQKAVVTGLFLKFLKNDFESSFEIQMGGVINQPLTIVCPAEINRLLTEEEEVVYVNQQVEKLDIVKYAGMEEDIYVPNYTELNESDETQIMLFAQDHTLVPLLKEKGIVLKTMKKEDKVFCITNEEQLEKIKTLVDESLFELFYYTKFTEVDFTTSMEDLKEDDEGKHAVALFQLNYVLVKK